MNTIKEKIQNVLHRMEPYGVSSSVAETILIAFAMLCLVFGAFFYFGIINPSGTKLVRNAQAAFTESLASFMTPAPKEKSPQPPTPIPQQPESTISEVPKQPADTSIVNQYISSTSYDEQKVKDTILNYLKSGSNVSLNSSDGYLYVNSSSTSTSTTTTTTTVTTVDGTSIEDIWLDTSGDSFTGQLLYNTTLSGNALKLVPSGDSGSLNSSGGVIFLNNTSNLGSGIGIYSNAGASAQGNMINIKVDNSAFNQAAFYMDYDGISNAVEITANTNDISSNALAVTSNNSQDSAVGFIGHENGRGTLKISHYKNAGFSDANASGLSIDLRNASNGEQTAAQGIYVDSTEATGTTGNLLRLRNQTIDRFVVNSQGSLQVGSSGTDTTITKIGNTTGDQFFVGTNGAFRVQRSASNSEAFRVQVNGDSQGRWLGTSDGQLKWGPGGSTTQDTVMKRIGVGQLSLEGGININNLNSSVSTVIKGSTDSNLFVADSSLNMVGIGAAVPTAKLHVSGDIRVTGGIYDSNNSLGSNGYILTSTGSGVTWTNPGATTGFVPGGNSLGQNAVLGTTDNFPLTFITNSIEGMRLDTSQNLGLGTTTASTRLTVSGADLSTQVDQTVGIANFAVNLTKNDTNTRTFYGVNIKPTLNLGGSNTTTTFNLLNVDTVNTATTGTTYNLLRLGDGGTTRFLVQSGGNLVASATTTGGTAYQYNFNSITTGNGVLLSVNALQSGIGLGVTSSSAAMSGQLANIVLSGSNSNNTGTLLRVASTGAANAGTVAMVSNAGTGSSFRINDDGTDTDSTPFLVDATGNVIIGGTSNIGSALLDVKGTVRVGTLSGGPSSSTLCFDANNIIIPCSSSKRFKTNIQTMSSSLDQIMQLRPVTYSWLANGEASLGLIAEEVFDVNPLLATHDSNGQIQGVRYDYLAAVLTKGIQEQQAQINVLNSKIESPETTQSPTPSSETPKLETRLTALEEKTASTSAEIHAFITNANSVNTASISGEITALRQELEALRGSVLSASASATLSSTDSVLNASSAATLTDLTVSNQATVNNLGITGTLSAGLLTIEGLDANGAAAINTLSGPLKLQSNGIGGVDVLNGKVVIESSGNVVINEGSLKGNDTIRGFNVAVKEHDTSLEITFSKPKKDVNYAVSVLPTWLTQIAIESKTKQGFKIQFSTSAPANAKLDWIVLE